jgi:ubiquinone/menaquinone biosynthesis C-methylase UbiE
MSTAAIIAHPHPAVQERRSSMPSPRQDTWESGDAYEPYVGRWSRLVAREFLAWLALPVGGRWLDIGCGTGALTRTILEGAAPSRILGMDRSDGYATYARSRIPDGRAAFVVGDAEALPVAQAMFDAAVSGLVLNFVPQPERMVAEMARILRPGGTAALFVWDYAGEMQLMRHFWDAATMLDAAAAEKDEGRRFPICKPEALARLLTDAGFDAVATRAVDVATLFRDFDDYWSPFLGGQGPAPGYAMSLPEERRAALRERIRAALPVAADGTISLIARAWAVRGTIGG